MDDTATGAVPVAHDGGPEADPEAGARPTALLPMTQLLRISAYWLGLTAIDAAVGLFITNRLEFDGLGPEGRRRQVDVLDRRVRGAIVGILVAADRGLHQRLHVSRWGRRKPYIVFGSLLDVVFLLGIATAGTVLALAAFMLLLASAPTSPAARSRATCRTSSPSPRWPRERHGRHDADRRQRDGLPARSIAVAFGVMELALVAVAIVELVTMLSVVLKVGKGMPPKPRKGRSWTTIAREAWATDVLQERSFVWLLVSRLLFLMAGSLLVNFVVIYLSRASA